MGLYDGLDLVLQSANAPRLDFVFVHSLGLRPETTWHDDSTGKNWVEEPDFVLGLGWRARVMSFRYNSDIASNMSAASILIHAVDLLLHLEKAMASSDNIGLFFIAHGLGGVIVKKALGLRDLLANCPRVRAATTGVVYLGTPHIDTNSEALLQTVKNTVQLLRHQHHAIEDDDVRHFASAVASINATYISTKSAALETISLWETEPSVWEGPDGSEVSDLVVPEACRKPDLWNNLDIAGDCKYLDLPHFSGLFDSRFTKFTVDFSTLVSRVLEHKTTVINAVRISATEVPMSGRPSSPPRTRGRRTRTGEAILARDGSATGTTDSEDELFASWQKRRQYQEDQERLDTFLRSLRGWLPQNTGHEVFVAAGTCDWISSNQALSNWLRYTMYGTFFCLAEHGSGKTHIAKALASHIEKTYPSNVVMAFFCTGNDPAPRIWDYFTWSLLQDRPSWFSSVPKRYLGRDEGSGRLSFGDFVSIWTSLRQYEEDGSKETIWLVIDGLEACGDEAFLRFWNSLEQLRKRQADSKKPLCFLKVLFTSTLTPAVTAVSGGVSKYIVPPAVVKKDIATYVDARLISFLVADSLPSVKSTAQRLIQDVKVASEDYWLFARDAVDEVELALGSNSAHVASFMSRLPAKLEAHVQQTLLCLRQSVGPARYLTPLLGIILANGKRLSVSQLKDALSSLYPAEEVERLDLADLAMRHCGGILVRGKGDCLTFRHFGLARWLGRDFTQGRRKATLAYLCMNYLLQDHFRALPRPDEVGPDPLSWLDRNHPFYYYAAQKCLAHLALTGSDDKLLSLFVRLPLESPAQWEVSQSWLRASLDYTATQEEFRTLPLAVVLRDERLLPILERVCPPPQDLTGLSCLQRAAYRWRSWRLRRNDPAPRFVLPKGWLSARNGDGYTPLLAAAKQGNVGMIKYILNWHPNVNERGGPFMQPILMMLYCSDVCRAPPRGPSRLSDITLDLLRMGANLNLTDCRGSSALHVACDQGSLPLVRLLLDHGAVINISDQDGCTAWQVACERGGVGLLRELLARGVEADSMFDTGENALTYLARKGWVDKLRAVLPLADVNGFDLKGEAPLHVAVRLDKDRYEILNLLISWPGVNLDLVSRLHGEADPEQATGLLAAIKADDGHGVELLLRAGATAGHLPGLKVLPLQLAVRLGHRDIAELLLRHRAPVNEFLFTPAKQTALSIAARAGDTDMLKLLLEYGADPTIEDGLDLPNAALLILECKAADIAALTLLLECPKPPCIVQDDDAGIGKSTLHSEVFMRACSLRGVDFAEALMGCGVRLSIWLSRPDLCSPLHAAARSGNLELCRFLVEKEPRFLNWLCRSGSLTHSPLHEACLHGQSQVVRLLLDKRADTKLLSTHREQSCLLAACIGNDIDTMKMVLAADPCMADVADYSGVSPLQVASRNGQVLVVGGLIEAGASMTRGNCSRHTCITKSLFGVLGDDAIRLLRMLIKHGLDINRPSDSLGQTPFFCALAAAPSSVVSWMYKKGGNPLRSCRLSASPEIWEVGLRGIRRELSPDVLEAMISSYREHLVDVDWSGQNALGNFSSGWRPYLARLFWLCEEIREETSRDLFAEMMVQPDIFGISPVDRSNGITSCRTRSRPDVARVIVELIDSYLETPSHQVLAQITHLPVAKLMHHAPEDIGPLLTVQYSARGIYTRPEDGSEVQSHASSTQRCLVCRKRILEEAFWCAKCDSHLCRTCVGKDEVGICGREDKHLWIWYALDAEVTAHSAMVQAALQRLRAAMLSIVSEQSTDRLSQSSTVISAEGDTDNKEARVQASLQLATLHAFGMLAIRRRLGAMYLPLSANALKIISPFEGNIAPMRKALERRTLDEETQVDRRREEMRYLSEGMMRTAYADEKLFRQDMMLEELSTLFADDDGIASDVPQLTMTRVRL